MSSTLCAIDKGWTRLTAIHLEYYVTSGQGVAKKSKKSSERIGQPENWDDESILRSQGLASRHVKSENCRRRAQADEKRQDRAGHRAITPKHFREVTCTDYRAGPKPPFMLELGKV
jgi:hypothetical protein